MQDFYIQQRTSKALNSSEIQRWFFTVVMLGPEGILMGDDETAEFNSFRKPDRNVPVTPALNRNVFDDISHIIERQEQIEARTMELLGQQSGNRY